MTKKILLTAVITTFTLAFTLHSCVSIISVAEQEQKAEAAYADGNYAQAFKHYETLVNQWNQSNSREENPYFDPAGHAAFSMGQKDKALEFFSQSMHYGTASVETYTRLIDYYREINNFSREMMTIEGLLEQFPHKPAVQNARERLFVMYAETARWEEAEAQWQYLDHEPGKAMLEQYLEVCLQLNNTKKGNEIARKLLAQEPGNVPALEWRALQYFNKAEARYTAEQEAYERNKTRRQYARLLEGYEAAGEDYRKARDIYERLFRNNPDPRYARYLFNIYARFQDKEKAEYYRSRM